MKTFHCTCGNLLFFESSRCLNCGSDVGYDPRRGKLIPIDSTVRLCANGSRHAVCNWLLPASANDTFCTACRLNRIIPDLSRGLNLQHWGLMEAAKRRLLYTLLGLNISLPTLAEDPQSGLGFDIVSTTLDPAATTGHLRGVITVSLEEADDTWRQINRQHLGEASRTLLGHFRHESGHYLWYRCFSSLDWAHPLRQAFREVFGDDTRDYSSALSRHYQYGPPPDWQQHYISAYAASHPWEDWAETWAHYLQMIDGFETCDSLGLRMDGVAAPAAALLPEAGLPDTALEDNARFQAWLQHWIGLASMLNEISRSFGAPFLYPFIISPPVARKLRLAHQFASQWRKTQFPAQGTSVLPASQKSTPARW